MPLAIRCNHSYLPEEEEEVKSKPSPEKKVKIESPPASGPAAAAAATTGSGGGPVEIVFSFDTTGSMYPCLTQVESDVQCIIYLIADHVTYSQSRTWKVVM